MVANLTHIPPPAAPSGPPGLQDPMLRRARALKWRQVRRGLALFLLVAGVFLAVLGASLHRVWNTWREVCALHVEDVRTGMRGAYTAAFSFVAEKDRPPTSLEEMDYAPPPGAYRFFMEGPYVVAQHVDVGEAAGDRWVMVGSDVYHTVNRCPGTLTFGEYVLAFWTSGRDIYGITLGVEEQLEAARREGDVARLAQQQSQVVTNVYNVVAESDGCVPGIEVTNPVLREEQDKAFAAAIEARRAPMQSPRLLALFQNCPPLQSAWNARQSTPSP